MKQPSRGSSQGRALFQNAKSCKQILKFHGKVPYGDDERGRRRWAATEAKSLVRGGISAVAEATGMSDRTIRNGIRELKKGCGLPGGQQRRKGTGRGSRKN